MKEPLNRQQLTRELRHMLNYTFPSFPIEVRYSAAKGKITTKEAWCLDTLYFRYCNPDYLLSNLKDNK